MRTQQAYDAGTLNDWKTRIDRAIPTPIYYQLKLLIKEKIESGQLGSGDMLPTEDNLSAALGISRPTIRQGMQELVTEGYLTRQKGKGTFVSRHKTDADWVARHESFFDIVRRQGYTPTVRVLDLRAVDPVPHINEALEIPPVEPLYYLKRLCLADGSPVLYTESYLQASRFPGFLRFDFSAVPLYETLRDAYRDPVSVIRREVGAANATRADAETLGIPKGRAVCLVHTLCLDAHSRPIEYSVTRCRGEFIKFTNYLKAD